jgi:hypothetical protein
MSLTSTKLGSLSSNLTLFSDLIWLLSKQPHLKKVKVNYFGWLVHPLWVAGSPTLSEPAPTLVPW